MTRPPLMMRSYFDVCAPNVWEKRADVAAPAATERNWRRLNIGALLAFSFQLSAFSFQLSQAEDDDLRAGSGYRKHPRPRAGDIRDVLFAAN